MKRNGGIGLLPILLIAGVGFIAFNMLKGNGGFIPAGDNIFPDITDEDLFGELAYG